MRKIQHTFIFLVTTILLVSCQSSPSKPERTVEQRAESYKTACILFGFRSKDDIAHCSMELEKSYLAGDKDSDVNFMQAIMRSHQNGGTGYTAPANQGMSRGEVQRMMQNERNSQLIQQSGMYGCTPDFSTGVCK